MVIVMDDEDREDEGDLIMAAEFATAEKVSRDKSTFVRPKPVSALKTRNDTPLPLST